MRTLVATIAAVLAGYPCMAAADSACIPVRVRTHATNGSAQRLAVLVAKELDRDSRFTRLPEGAPGTLTISLPDQLGWERSLGWTLVSYQARLDAADGRIQVLKGHCWNWNLRACAQQILSSAAGSARTTLRISSMAQPPMSSIAKAISRYGKRSSRPSSKGVGPTDPQSPCFA